MSRPARQFYEFGSFRVDAGERQLSRDGEVLPLTPKVFELLLALVENNRHTITKAELLDRIWPGSFVEENSLSRNISLLRKALEGEESRSYVRTVPKLGYRFDADVRVVVEDEEDVIVERRTRYSVQFQDEKDRDAASWARLPVARIFAITAGAITIALLGFAMLTSRPDGFRSATLASAAPSAPTRAVDPEAFDLYRRGRALWQDRSAAGLHQSILLLEQAVERDPDFALAWAALADAYAFDARHWKKAESVAQRAIELDPQLGNPHASIGFVNLFWEWRTRDAETAFRKAITLSPDYATARQWYAINLSIVGHYNEAYAEMNRAIELDPNAPAINADLCQMLYVLQRYDEAEAQCRKTLRLDPTSFNAHSSLYSIFTAQRRYDEAVPMFMARERIGMNSTSIPEGIAALQAAYERGGIGDFWRKRVEYLRMPGGSAYELARYHALLGDDDAAILELDRACRSHEFGFIFFFSEPTFRRFADEPRFETLVDDLVADRLPTACGGKDL